VIPSAWKTKPRVARHLTLMWGLIALQFLIYGGILKALDSSWSREAFSFYACFVPSLIAVIFCWGHFKTGTITSNIAWSLGTLTSLLGTIFTAYLIFEAARSLVSFLRFGHLSYEDDPVLQFGSDVTLPVLAASFCGLTSGFVLMLAAFLLATSRPARVAYGAET
jgi:hypothetical protein